MLIKIILIAGLLFIFYQDVRYRAVYWVLFPLLLIPMLILAIEQMSLNELANNSGINLAFILIQLSLLFVYFSAKARSWVNITTGYLGWGDILFLLLIAFYLSPANYLLFYIVSLIIVLICAIAVLIFQRTKEITIPLAGLQSLFFALVLIMDWEFPSINITNDDWLLTYLYL